MRVTEKRVLVSSHRYRMSSCSHVFQITAICLSRPEIHKPQIHKQTHNNSSRFDCESGWSKGIHLLGKANVVFGGWLFATYSPSSLPPSHSVVASVFEGVPMISKPNLRYQFKDNYYLQTKQPMLAFAWSRSSDRNQITPQTINHVCLWYENWDISAYQELTIGLIKWNSMETFRVCLLGEGMGFVGGDGVDGAADGVGLLFSILMSSPRMMMSLEKLLWLILLWEPWNDWTTKARGHVRWDFIKSVVNLMRIAVCFPHRRRKHIFQAKSPHKSLYRFTPARNQWVNQKCFEKKMISLMIFHYVVARKMEN